MGEMDLSGRSVDEVLRLAIPGCVYLGVLGLAESITYYVSEPSGVVLYFVVLLFLLIGSAATRKEGERGLWLSLGLVPRSESSV